MAASEVCERCGAAVEPGQRFCGSCGHTLVRVCSSCGQPSPGSFTFCGACGAKLPESELPRGGEERRIITVLFADLVGFTARAERLDPEDVRAILHPYYARLRAEIEAYGGIVEKFIGDAVMAIFGAPVTHGDDPERAVRAALSIRDAINDMNAAGSELDLQLRVAVNTGEAIVAMGASPSEGEGMVAGDVVNTASRLQTAAPVNSILVGEGTHRATHTVIEYEEIEALTLKGKDSPVRAWVATRASLAPGIRATADVPLVGRDRELATLFRLWESTAGESRVNLVTIVGDAGIGKTRLATALLDRVAADGGRSLQGRVLPYGSSTPYGPFSGQVKQRAGIFASDTVDAARTKLGDTTHALIEHGADEVATHIAMLIGLATEGEVPERRILFFAARRLAEALGREQPTVLLFEDLHWADSGMLDLLELLAARVREVPLLLLGLARPDLLHSRPAWGGGLPASTAIRLEPLDAEAGRELAGRFLARATDGAHEAAAERIADTAEGNPLFLEELAASVAEHATSAADVLPTTVREIIAARLDGLPATERALLLNASVVGRVFWAGALERGSDNAGQIDDTLDSLEARGLIAREPVSWIESQPQFSFKHVLIRDVAYATVPRARRRHLHTVAASFLEAAAGGAGATATALADHWQEAGDIERAVRYLLVAADQSGRSWAKYEAATLYKRALDLVPEEQRDRRRDIARRRALALQALYHVTDAQQLARRGDPGAAEES